MKKIILLFIIISILTSVSCSKKASCPAYDENQKEEYKTKGSKKHKKAKLF